MSEVGASFLYGCGVLAALVGGIWLWHFWPQTLATLMLAGLVTALGYGVRCFLRLTGWIY